MHSPRRALAACSLVMSLSAFAVPREMQPLTDAELREIPPEPVTALIGTGDKRNALQFDSVQACLAFSDQASRVNLAYNHQGNLTPDDALVTCISRRTGEVRAAIVRDTRNGSLQQVRPAANSMR